MAKRLSAGDMMGLSPKHAAFVIEYMKDFNARRAATASGFEPDTGYVILARDDVASVVDHILQQRLEVAMIDADWLLYEMVDNHLLARQQDNIPASNNALSMVGKHKRVDAFAAEKLKVSTDADVVDRLVAGRMRVKSMTSEDLLDDVEGVSFL